MPWERLRVDWVNEGKFFESDSGGAIPAGVFSDMSSVSSYEKRDDIVWCGS